MNEKLKIVLKKYESHPEFLGIDIAGPNQRGAVDDSPMHVAARKGDLADLEVMIAGGGDVNLVGDLSNTPLHNAAMRGHVAVVKRLIELGANQNLTNEFSQTALDVARLGGHQEVMQILK